MPEGPLAVVKVGPRLNEGGESRRVVKINASLVLLSFFFSLSIRDQNKRIGVYDRNEIRLFSFATGE